MLAALGLESLDELIDAAMPESIRLRRPLDLGDDFRARGEFELIERLGEIADKNQVFRSCIGMGYSDTITPPVIQRNILENPGWYTQYTPYQAEIAQGRLEALLNFQTMVARPDRPAAGQRLPARRGHRRRRGDGDVPARSPGLRGETTFFVADDCHPQTIAVVQTRAEVAGHRVRRRDAPIVDFASAQPCFGVLAAIPRPPTAGSSISPT